MAVINHNACSDFWQLVGRYCSYLLPKQDGGTQRSDHEEYYVVPYLEIPPNNKAGLNIFEDLIIVKETCPTEDTQIIQIVTLL